MNEIKMAFRHPHGHIIVVDWHPAVAAYNRMALERKGFVMVDPDAVEPAPVPAPEPDAEPKPKKNKKLY